MGRVMLCLGEYAQTPYYLDKMQRNVYCIEELCYSFLENAFLLDQDIVNRSLVEWLEEECGLKELAGQLYGYVNAKCSVNVFVTVILEYAAYCPQEEIENVGRLLKNNANLTDMEKRKSHADFLLQNERYAVALAEYDGILKALAEEAGQMRAQTLHNKAIAYAGLFLFEEAAECFEEAYRQGLAESRECYFAAKRLSMKKPDYISFIAGQTEEYEPSVELEQRIEQILLQWQGGEQGTAWQELMNCRAENRMSDYYEQVEKQTAKMKSEYRKMAI